MKNQSAIPKNKNIKSIYSAHLSHAFTTIYEGPFPESLILTLIKILIIRTRLTERFGSFTAHSF